MVKSQLVMALDFQKDKKVPHEVFTYRNDDGQWYIVRRGPGYCNTHKVIEFDDAGLAQLLAKERRDENTEQAHLPGPLTQEAIE